MSILRISDSKKGARELEPLKKETQLHLMVTSHPVQGPEEYQKSTITISLVSLKNIKHKMATSCTIPMYTKDLLLFYFTYIY